MTYHLGVDLGTTYTAAAVLESGRARVIELGNRTPTIPSVVFLTEEGTVLTGEAANRRAVTDPTRVAREFKRRIGDTTPLLLGGTPYSADALSGMLLRWTVDQVSERQGSAPESVAVTYPANWGPFKRDLLDQAIRQADLDNVATVTEPEAAVIYYASHERIDPGAVVAVYDLGGGTFDAAVVRKLETGVEVLGEPEGIERLGGIDFDEAVFAHVRNSLGDAIAELDPNDPVALSAMARLRQECVDAKEALSSDSEASIPVVLPSVATEVRLTRAEFERMISPTLAPTITALQRALRSANLTPDQVDTILLAGGSSRIPLVAQMVGAEMGRPVAVDAHPKHAVALGAAHAAEEIASGGGAAAAPPAPAPAPTPPPPARPDPGPPPVVPPAPAVPPAPTPGAGPAPAAPRVAPSTPEAPPTTSIPAAQVTQIMPTVPPSGPSGGMPTAPTAPSEPTPPAGSPPPGMSDPLPAPGPADGGGGGSRKWFLVGLAAVVLAVAGFFIASSLGGGGDEDPEDVQATDDGNPQEDDGNDTGAQPADDDGEVEETPTEEAQETPTEAPTPTEVPPTPTPAPVPVPAVQGQTLESATATIEAQGLTVGFQLDEVNDEVPAGSIIRTEPEPGTELDEGGVVNLVVSTGPDPLKLPCPDDAPRCIEIIDAARDGNLLTINWEANFEPVSRAGAFHAHFFWDIYEPEQAGNNAGDFGVSAGSWDAVDAQPYVKDLSTQPAGAEMFCVTVGNPTHGVDDPTLFQCIDIPEG